MDDVIEQFRENLENKVNWNLKAIDSFKGLKIELRRFAGSGFLNFWEIFIFFNKLHVSFITIGTTPHVRGATLACG